MVDSLWHLSLHHACIHAMQLAYFCRVKLEEHMQIAFELVIRQSDATNTYQRTSRKYLTKKSISFANQAANFSICLALIKLKANQVYQRF